MPTVPQYQRSVSPQVTPNKYIELNVNEDMFGTNVSRAQQNVANALGGIGELVESIKDRVEDTKLIELKNKSAEWEQQNIYDNQNGYLYKTGKDAYGQSETLLKSYDTYMQDLLQKSNLSPSARRRAQGAISDWRIPVQRTITKHDFEQGVSWAGSEAATGLSNYVSNAVNMRNNPDEIKKSIESGYQIIEWKGEIQHLDRTAIDAEKRKYLMSVNEAVLNSYLGEGSLKASDYLEENKGSISPEKLPQYISAVKENELTYTARQTAFGLVGLPIEQVYQKINMIDDPQTRNAVMKEYNIITNQQESIQSAKNSEFMNNLSNQLADALANGGDANQLKQDILKSDLPFDVKQKQIGFINDCLELNQEVHLWNETEYLDNLMYSDFEAFQKVDLGKFALSKAERQKYLEAQRKVVNYSTESQLRDMVKQFDTFFMAGKNSLDSGVYKDELIGLLARIEKLQGSAFDINNIDEGQLLALREGFDYEDKTVANKNINETKELYMRAKAVADVQERVARAYTQFKAQNKREPEPQEMFNMVRKIYNDVGRENKARVQGVVNKKLDMQKNISNAKIKKSGYTKVLTNFEERTIPALEKETGVKMNITSTYRSSGKYGHEKGMKADVFPAVASKQNILKAAGYLISSPDVEVIFTSNPYVLQRYGTNKKVQDARKYDASAEAKKAGIEHVTHFDIRLTSQFGGTEQMKQSYISAAPKPVITRR